jgi:hypothetical protein
VHKDPSDPPGNTESFLPYSQDDLEVSMDAITKFRDFQLPEEPQETQTAPQQESSPTTMPGGLGSARESVEKFETHSLFDEFLLPETSTPQSPPVAQTPPDTGAPATPAPTGNVNWDAILFLKEQLSKQPPDWQAMFQSLEQLSPEDRARTLKQLAGDGDFANILAKMYTPQAHQEMANFIGLLFQDSKNPDAAAALNLTLQTLRQQFGGQAADTIREFLATKPDLSAPQDKGNEPGGLESNIEEMMKILDADPSANNRLDNLLFMQEMRNQHAAPYPDAGKFPILELRTKVQDFMSGFASGDISADPSAVEQALQAHPKLGTDALLDCMAIETCFTKMLQAGQNFGPQLGEILKMPGQQTVLKSGLRLLEMQGGPVADDIVRSMLDTASKDPNFKLSDLPPTLLIDLKAILSNGDDQPLDQQLIQSIIDPALQIANSR